MEDNTKKLVKELAKNNIIVLQEECAELIQALTKYQRYGLITDNLYEEVADVLNSIEWLIEYLDLSINTINRVREEKVARAIERYKESGELK